LQRLRAEHDVDPRRALQNRGAFLARDTAAHADDEVRVPFFQLAPTAEQREHLVLCLLAHGARVDEQDVGFFHIAALLADNELPSTSAILAESYSFIWQP